MGEEDKKQGGEKAPQDDGLISREDVAKHKTMEDCWIVIHGVAYNVTSYLDEHPGGPEIINDLAGQDATDEFEDTGHSPEARETLAKFKVGDVKGGALAREAGSGGAASSSEGPSLLFMLGVLLALAVGAYVVMQGDEEEAAKEL